MDTIQRILGGYVDLDNNPLSKTTLSVTACVVVLSWFVWDEIKFRRNFGKADYRPPFNPLGLLGVVFAQGLEFTWPQRFTLYPRKGREYVVFKPWAYGKPIIYTNSVDILRQTGGSGVASAWEKPDWSVTPHSRWGDNLISTHGVEWKKHRKIMQPAFNPKTYEMVWTETLKLYNQMIICEKFPTKSGGKVSFPRFEDLTQRVALCIILSCGFGIPINWDEKDLSVKREGYKLDDGVRTQSDHVILLAHGPDWIFKLPIKKLRMLGESTRGLRAWFKRAVTKKRAEIEEHLQNNDGTVDYSQLRNDVFTRLNLVNYIDEKVRLSESEIIGNTWSIFFAGHETTAGTLAATFCLLAANPKEQDVLYNEAKEVMDQQGTDQLPFECYDSLPKTRAALVEALRIYPAGSILIRQTVKDTVVQVPVIGDDGTRRDEGIHFPKDTVIVGDMIGMQYNTRVFPNPGVYDPSRWYDATSDDAYTAFSVGPRTCIGRKFSLTEGVCWIAHIMKNFTVEPLLAPGEDLEGWKKRVLEKTSVKLSFSVTNAPLVFKKR